MTLQSHDNLRFETLSSLLPHRLTALPTCGGRLPPVIRPITGRPHCRNALTRAALTAIASGRRPSAAHSGGRQGDTAVCPLIVARPTTQWPGPLQAGRSTATSSLCNPAAYDRLHCSATWFAAAVHWVHLIWPTSGRPIAATAPGSGTAWRWRRSGGTRCSPAGGRTCGRALTLFPRSGGTCKTGWASRNASWRPRREARLRSGDLVVATPLLAVARAHTLHLLWRRWWNARCEARRSRQAAAKPNRVSGNL
jgi:hypothetical protein